MTLTAEPTPGLLRGPRHKERPEPVTRTVSRRDVAGTVLGQVELAPEVFGIEPNLAVLHQVVTAQLAAARSGTQSTLTRAEVRGGGAKPYRQKGTGRARQGSTRAAQFSGGGKALGPKPRSYRQRTPKKMVRLALCSALSDRAAEERVALVDTWGWEAPRTKAAVAFLQALGLEGKVLVVLGPDDVVAERSFGNLPRVQTIPLAELSAYDVLKNDWVVFTDDTLLGVSGIEIEIEIEIEAETDDEGTSGETGAVEAGAEAAAADDTAADDTAADDTAADDTAATAAGDGEQA